MSITYFYIKQQEKLNSNIIVITKLFYVFKTHLYKKFEACKMYI